MNDADAYPLLPRSSPQVSASVGAERWLAVVTDARNRGEIESHDTLRQSEGDPCAQQ
jgi:hypothetical protein